MFHNLDISHLYLLLRNYFNNSLKKHIKLIRVKSLKMFVSISIRYMGGKQYYHHEKFSMFNITFVNRCI